MIFSKPADVSYTDMAKYVDSHIYADCCDELKCYEYIYHLFYMLAYKKRFFETSSDYENYSIFAASKVFSRYRNPKQRKGKLLPLKSCLNYIKKLLYPLKVDYQQMEYEERFQPENLPAEELQSLKSDLERQVISNNRDFVCIEVQNYLQSIPYIIKSFLKIIPYKSDKIMMHDIYLSCVLSLLRMMTLSNANKARIDAHVRKPSENLDDLIESLYIKESNDDVVLFHLPESMRNYIRTLVMKIKRLIAKDILYLSGHENLSDDIIRGVLMSPMENYRGTEDD